MCLTIAKKKNCKKLKSYFKNYFIRLFPYLVKQIYNQFLTTTTINDCCRFSFDYGLVNIYISIFICIINCMLPGYFRTTRKKMHTHRTKLIVLVLIN